MNLIELQQNIENAIECVRDRGQSPEDIPVTLQLEDEDRTFWGEALEVIEDNNTCASGCVIRANIDGEDS